MEDGGWSLYITIYRGRWGNRQMTYSPSLDAGHGPGSSSGGCLGTARHPDVCVLVTVAGGSVPVARGVVVRHVDV